MMKLCLLLGKSNGNNEVNRVEETEKKTRDVWRFSRGGTGAREFPRTKYRRQGVRGGYQHIGRLRKSGGQKIDIISLLQNKFS